MRKKEKYANPLLAARRRADIIKLGAIILIVGVLLVSHKTIESVDFMGVEKFVNPYADVGRIFLVSGSCLIIYGTLRKMNAKELEKKTGKIVVEKFSLDDFLGKVLLAAIIIMIGYFSLGIWPPEEVKVNVADNGRLIELRKVIYGGGAFEGTDDLRGDFLVITLGADPADGYFWEVTEFNKQVLHQLPTLFKPENDTPGAKGMQTLRFSSVNKGSTPLKLVYHRLNDTEPLKTFSILVVIR